MHRFFVPPDWIKGLFVTLEGPLAHQVANVLRLREGERIVVLDNSGWERVVELDIVTKQRAGGKVVRRTLGATEPRVKVTLYQSVLKSDHFEFVLQKCTELGAAAFVPLITARTILGSVGDVDAARLRRWQRIVVEAAEQSGRTKLPLLRPAILFQSACEDVAGLSLIPWEEERVTSLRSVLRDRFGGSERSGGARQPFSVNLFIGPEGGFTAEEADLARRYEVAPVSLGARILRAETAAVVATAAVLYEAGDMAP